MTRTDAERARLLRALAEGPDRRMAADKLAGRQPTKADMEQAARYRRALATLPLETAPDLDE